MINAKKIDSKIESIIIPMIKVQPKLLLTGSLSLYMLDILKRKSNDVDLGLKESLTKEELELLINFFELKIASSSSDVDEYSNSVSTRPKTIDELLKCDIMSFLVKNPMWKNGDMDETKDEAKEDMYLFKIDIFNKVLVEDKDIIVVNYEFTSPTSVNTNITIPLCHPSIPISYKAKYAFDPRVSSSYKHSNDLKDLLLNLQSYFEVIKKKFK
jgi:hypothetical protein